MDRKHLEEDLRSIEKELSEEKDLVKKTSGPMFFIVVIILILLMVMMGVPYYYIKLNPEPKYIPTFEEVLSFQITTINITQDRNIKDKSEILNFLEPNDPRVKLTADKIISLSKCPSDHNCYAKTIFYFVRDNVDYVKDPPDDYIKPFDEIIVTKVGDCDDKAVLLANLLQSIGIYTRFVFVPNHAYLIAYMPDAPKKYHDKEQYGWINLDPTCEYCTFGEVPAEHYNERRVFV